MRQDMRIDIEERWRVVEEIPNYDVSDRGNVYNTKTNRMMRISTTSFGHAKINLTAENGQQFTRSVAQLVAVAFVEPPTGRCDQVVVLDGDFTNLSAENLVWRPTWYAYQYTRQLKTQQFAHYCNLPIRNVSTGVVYPSVVAAGMAEGLLFTDVWRSTYTGDTIFPNWSLFEVFSEKV